MKRMTIRRNRGCLDLALRTEISPDLASNTLKSWEHFEMVLSPFAPPLNMMQKRRLQFPHSHCQGSIVDSI